MKNRLQKIIAGSLMAIFVISGITGCALFTKAANHQADEAKAHPVGVRYVVSAVQTPFYKYGPIQSGGADYLLKKGAFVTLAKYDSDYSRVTMDNSTSGYVATGDIAPAPAPAPTPKLVLDTEYVKAHKHSGSQTISPANQAAVTEQLGPVPDLPTGKTPKFRY